MSTSPRLTSTGARRSTSEDREGPVVLALHRSGAGPDQAGAAAPTALHPQGELFPGLRLLTPDEVANMLGVSRDWVRDHATRRQPRIPAVRLGGKRTILRFRQKDIEAFITARLSS
jgi:excisionase family DNA binding protein